MGMGGGMPAMPTPMAAPPRREPQVFTEIPQYELNRFELSRIGPDQFVDSRGNTRSGPEVKSLIASQPESAETRSQRQQSVGERLSVEQPLATLAQVDTAAAAAAKKAEEDRARGRYGVRETSVTGPLGLSGPAPTRYATLLGA